MSINANDFSKQGINYSLNTEKRAADEFALLRQASAKVIQQTSGTNQTGNRNEQYSASAASQVGPSDIEMMNKQMSQLNVHLTFELTDGKDPNIIKVLDEDTGDLVRQIPTEEFLRMSDRIDAIIDQLSDVKGTLVNSEV